MNHKLLAALSALALTAALLAPGSAVAPASAANDIQAPARTLQQAFRAVVRKARPAVVFIQVEQKVAGLAPGSLNDPFDLFNHDFLQRFFRHRAPRPNRQPREYVQRGQGSGFLISSDGLILTNHHVVGKADRIRVRLSDKREFSAKVIGTDEKSDVALIQIDGKNLPHLEVGDSDRIEVGDLVLAIGNPFGLSETVTSGIVSAKGRTTVGISDYENYIQTDAAINPGNSGGPLLNLDGKIIGINSAIVTRTGGYMGIGFAVPINLAMSIERQLQQHGKVVRGFLGVLIQDLTPDLAKAFKLERHSGALVAQVTPGSPAAKAGLEAGDVLVAVGGASVEGSGDARNRIASLAPGSKVRLSVLRAGKEQVLVAKLGTLTDPEATATAGLQEAPSAELGMTLGPLTAEAARESSYPLGHGVLVTAVASGSIAALAGLRPGDLVLAVDHKAVNDVETCREAMAAAAPRGRVLLHVREGHAARFLVLAFPDRRQY